MTSPRLRRTVRALLIDPAGFVLLCRFDFLDQGIVLWTAPGGGVEPGESPLDALRRELDEEVGLTLRVEPRHVWRQEVVSDGWHAPGYDGVINDFYLVPTARFEPCGSLGDAAVRAEGISAFRWWSPEHLRAPDGAEVFGPRNLAGLLAQLASEGLPRSPLMLGL